jgi:signal transduction histidine kinase
MRVVSPRLAWQLFVLSLLLLGAFGYFGFTRAQRYRESEALVAHTQEVETQIAVLRGDVAAASSARYQLEVDPGALARYEASSSAVGGVLDELQQLTSDNALQQANIARLRPLVSQQMRAIARGMPGAPAEERHAAAVEEAQLGESTSAIFRGMRSEEEQLLATRFIISDRDRRSLRDALFLGIALVLSIMIFAFRTIFVQLSLRRESESAVRRLSAHILSIQDAERRRLARELHDGVGQIFAGLSMELEAMARNLQLDETQRLSLSGARDLVREGLAQTRTLSYLLHPPMLEDFGLEQAATWYVEGFTTRSGVSVDLKFSQPFRRLPEPVELVLFRVMQESLTNVHRHSGSKRAQITLTLHPDRVALVIRDFGNGIPEELRKSIEQSSSGGGVGLGGMRERVAELGGRLGIASSWQGTTLNVSLPLSAEHEATAASDASPGGSRQESGSAAFRASS